MENWGAELYGQPCAQCGYDWAISGRAAADAMAAIPDLMAAAVAGATGDELQAPFTWTPAGYVSHVADNLHIGGERLIAAIDAGVTRVHGYDQDELAAARGYAHIPLTAALWSLGHSVSAWRAVVDKALQQHVALEHDAWGRMSAEDVVRTQAHDAFHHLQDITAIVQAAQ